MLFLTIEQKPNKYSKIDISVSQIETLRKQTTIKILKNIYEVSFGKTNHSNIYKVQIKIRSLQICDRWVGQITVEHSRADTTVQKVLIKNTRFIDYYIKMMYHSKSVM